MSETSTMGERIKAVRIRAGLGQDQFAAALDYSKRSLVSWEADATEPPIAILPKLRDLYDVSPEWIVKGDDVTPRSYYGPVDWDRLDRIRHEVDQVCAEVRLKLKPEQSVGLTRALFDGGADAGPANKKQLRDTLRALSLGK